MKAIVAAFLVSIDPHRPSTRWGYEGHRIVAEISEQFLQSVAARQVHKLLALENAHA